MNDDGGWSLVENETAPFPGPFVQRQFVWGMERVWTDQPSQRSITIAMP